MTILEKVVTTMQQLPIDQQQQVLRFIEFLAFELGNHQVNQDSENSNVKKPEASPHDLLRKWEGVIEGGVDDLSFNKKYMEEYDLSQLKNPIRGKYSQRYQEGYSVTIHHEDGTTTVEHFPKQNDIIILDPDVKQYE